MTEGRPMRILLVDDDEALCIGIDWMIRQSGHESHVVHSGIAALDVFAQGLDADLVLLDLGMPVMGGEETLRRLLKLRPWQPVVIISGFGDERVQKVLVEWPQVSYLGKPFSREELQRVMDATSSRPVREA